MRKVRGDGDAPLGGIEFSRATAAGSTAGLAADADAPEVVAQAAKIEVLTGRRILPVFIADPWILCFYDTGAGRGLWCRGTCCYT